jgi:hypothetical protein
LTDKEASVHGANKFDSTVRAVTDLAEAVFIRAVTDQLVSGRCLAVRFCIGDFRLDAQE